MTRSGGMHSLRRNLATSRTVRAGKVRIGVLCLMATTCVLSSCSRRPPEQAGGARPAVPVRVATAISKTVPVQVQAVGTVQAYKAVSVLAQVSAELRSVHFEDGQHVKAGDLLFSLDARPFQAELDQAQANLAKDQAQLENARVELKRNAAVVEKGYVSQEQYDQAVATAAALQATVQADQAAIETARLQLEYCTIHSPVDGVMGAVLIDSGNIVKANDTGNPLVVVNQVRPIYVAFYVPQKYLPQVRKYMAMGKLAVEATTPGYEASAPRGELTFIDNTINPSAGTIQLRATFANEDEVLWPGQFVNAVLTLTSQPGAVVVPSQAVQTGQKGLYVFVVKSDLTVEYRPVEVSMTVDGESVITKGVQAGLKVVTDGQLRLADGSPVKIVDDLNREGDRQP
jgi:multidrug efflux system membrane fusion protein